MPDNSSDDSTLGRDVNADGTTSDNSKEQDPAGAAGRGTQNGLAGKVKQGLNALTGRDLDTASTEDVEHGAQAGAGGEDGR